jgi:O-antigen ligase
MDLGKAAVFLIVTLISVTSFLAAENKFRALLMISAFVFIFRVGWIFYNYNGIWVSDIPLLLLVLYGLASGNFKWYFPKISLVILGLIAWSLISSASAPEPGWAVSQTTVLMRGYLIFIAVINTLKTPKDIYYLVMTLLAGYLFESFLGVWQWRYDVMGLSFLGERLWREGGTRSMGTFFVPSYFGNYLIFLLPLVYRLFIYQRPFRKWETYAYGGITLLAVLALFSAYARGPWISVAIVIGLITLFSFLKRKYRPRTKWAVGLLIVFGFAFGIKYSSVIMDQFGPYRQAAADIRKDQWRIAVRVIEDNPLLGTGPGNYENLSANYVIREELEDWRSWQFSEMVHNSYLLVAAETGVPGGVLFILCLLFIFKQAWKTFNLQIPYFRNIGIGIGGGFLALAMSFYYSPDIHEYQMTYQFCLLGGILFALDRLELRCIKQYKYAQMKKMAGSTQPATSKHRVPEGIVESTEYNSVE